MAELIGRYWTGVSAVNYTYLHDTKSVPSVISFTNWAPYKPGKFHISKGKKEREKEREPLKRKKARREKELKRDEKKEGMMREDVFIEMFIILLLFFFSLPKENFHSCLLAFSGFL